MQSDPAEAATPRHVAIIMDGNGRWARRRGLPRSAGHRAGAAAVRRTLEAAPELGITTLTLYAFSSDNWRRPASEVGHLMRLFERYLATEVEECLRAGVRLSVIGRRDRLPHRLLGAIDSAERRTRRATRLDLRLAVDYSGRAAIVEAARGLAPGGDLLDFRQRLLGSSHSASGAPDVDLLIRSGGERRLSDFLLWESAYAELWFTDRLWPDFGAADLGLAVADFGRRERRFGALPAAGERRIASPAGETAP